jgi:hypothetical protein
LRNPYERNLASRNAAPLIGTYICEPAACVALTDNPTCPWGMCYHEDTHRRLSWQYGEGRANRISLGIDAATEADLAAWRELGR